MSGAGPATRGTHSKDHWVLQVCVLPLPSSGPGGATAPFIHSLCRPHPPIGDLNKTECDKQTCVCDKNVVLCLMNQTYREEYRGFLNVYCQGPTPNCSIYEPPPEEVT